jgi:hypothetical protein
MAIVRIGETGVTGWKSLAPFATDPYLDAEPQAGGWSVLRASRQPTPDMFAWTVEAAADMRAPVMACVIDDEDAAMLYGASERGSWSVCTRTGSYHRIVADEQLRIEHPDLDAFDDDDDDAWRTAQEIRNRYAEMADELLSRWRPDAAAAIVGWAAETGHPEVPAGAVEALLRRGDDYGIRFLDRLLYMIGISDHVYVPDLKVVSANRPADDWAWNRDPRPPRFSV